jgi:hypothetical protein
VREADQSCPTPAGGKISDTISPFPHVPSCRGKLLFSLFVQEGKEGSVLLAVTLH